MGIRIILLCLSIILFSGCSLRVFKDKVPEPNRKSQEHRENEREGAFYLAENVELPTHKFLAEALSRSLGLPMDREKKSAEIAESLGTEITRHESRARQLNEELTKHQGHDIEGTGFNILPAISSVSFIGFIILLILFPSAITVFFFLLKRSRLAFSNLVKGVSKFSDKEPEAGIKLNEILERELDRKEKLMAKKVE
jgi:hypothetical protein